MDYHHGSGLKYTRFMEDRYGSDYLDIISQRAKSSRKYTEEELLEIKGKYLYKIDIEEEGYVDRYDS